MGKKISEKPWWIGLIFALALIGAGVLACLARGWKKPSVEIGDPISEEKKLIIYTSHEETVYRPIIKEFEERTGIWVEVVSGSSNELLKRIAREEKDPSADIMFGGGVDSLSAYEEYFQTYICKQNEFLKSAYSSKNRKWTVFSSLPIVFIYNKKLVYPKDVPESWEELLDPGWKGKIAFADPRKSGTAYTALATLLQVFREEKAFDEVQKMFMDNLDGNVSPSSADVILEVMSGTRMVGITTDQKALNSVRMGVDVEMIYPAEGTTMVPDGCAIVNHAPHQDNAELFLEFTVSEDVQRYLADQCYRRPVRQGIEMVPVKKEFYYDIEWTNLHKDEILTMWTEQMDREEKRDAPVD